MRKALALLVAGAVLSGVAAYVAAAATPPAAPVPAIARAPAG